MRSASHARRLAGPDGEAITGCESLDLDSDQDIDLRDFAQFQNLFTGSR